MKKIVLILSGLITLFSSLNAQNKAFQKGDVTISLGIGVAVYGTQVHSAQNTIGWTGSGIGTVRITKDTTDAAASAIYPLSVEYGILNWLGVGARMAYSNYFAQSDSISGVKPSAHSFDGDVFLNLHIIKTKRFDMPIQFMLGYSNFKYMANNAANTIGKDNGLNYGIALVPRIYFGSHFGIFFNIAYMGYSYPSLTFSDNTDSNINDNTDWLYKLKGSGGNIGGGLIVKF